MQTAHFHLLVNHFPIIGGILALLTLAAGLILGSRGIRQAGLGLVVVAGLFVLPAYFSGEGAEEAIEQVAPEAEGFVEAHEELGETALWTCLGMALLGIVGLFMEIKEKPVARLVGIALLVFGGANVYLMHQLGNTGGEIRHSEIRGGGVSVEQEEEGEEGKPDGEGR